MGSGSSLCAVVADTTQQDDDLLVLLPHEQISLATGKSIQETIAVQANHRLEVNHFTTLMGLARRIDIALPTLAFMFEPLGSDHFGKKHVCQVPQEPTLHDIPALQHAAAQTTAIDEALAAFLASCMATPFIAPQVARKGASTQCANQEKNALEQSLEEWITIHPSASLAPERPHAITPTSSQKPFKTGLIGRIKQVVRWIVIGGGCIAIYRYFS